RVPGRDEAGPRRVRAGRKALGDDESIDFGDRDVEQHDVGGQRGSGSEPCLPVDRLADHRPAVVLEESSRGGPETAVVVDDEDRRPRHGTRTHGCRSRNAKKSASTGSSECSKVVISRSPSSFQWCWVSLHEGGVSTVIESRSPSTV